MYCPARKINAGGALCINRRPLRILSFGGKIMTKFTSIDLEVLSGLLMGEGMACKKARMYSKTLTDAALAECMGKIADCHEQRFQSLLSILEGK